MRNRQATGTVPTVDTDKWALTVTGTVNRQLELSVDDFERLPLEPFTDDLMCLDGKQKEGQTWRGIRIDDLFRLADPTPQSRRALVRGVNQEYACSFRMGRLEDAVLVVEHDGNQLPVEHGGPARLVPTDSEPDCWESVKWLTEIDVREQKPQCDDTDRG